ncbi:MAG TPA: prolyl oligopeptidase family serine peptidase [Streptosporangiaceae bacterium]
MTDSVSPPRIPYGAWPSPITAADVAKGQVLISYPMVTGTDVWWQEGRPDEGGRVTVVRCDADGQQRAMLPAPWNARSRVHEYGGRAYLPVPGRPGDGQGGPAGPAVVFANYADQRLYLVSGPGGDAGAGGAQGGRAAAGPADAGAPVPLTPVPADDAPAALRFADFILSADGREVWCVQERHEGGKITRSLVAVPLDGSAAEDPAAIRELVSGPDFFAFPTLSPDGSRLAWICWNHPRMPWDGTELRVAQISDGVLGRGRLVKGGMRESVLAPVWRDETSLYVVSDWPGWWNLYQVGLVGEPAQALYPAEEEFAEPLWQLGGRPYAALGDGRLAVLHGQGGMRLGLLDPETGELADPELPFQEFVSGVSADGTTIVAVAGGPQTPLSVVRIDAASGKTEVLRRESEEVPEAGYLPVPSQVRLEGQYGRNVHALVYPPTHPDAVAPDGELPPYIVWAHGGPTSHVIGLLDLEKAYFTSRGIGVIDVNYGGSTGYGRSYRERLRMQWGVVDVEDAVAAGLALAGKNEADPDRLGIRGASAGGWTALAAVTTHAARHRVFSAAASYFGVADLREFAAETHDFESHYLDGLIGPLPGFEYVYAERSPAGHVTDATCPVLLLQGLDDPIVPPRQAESIAADLTAHGIRHALLTFKGESHGFRRAETIIAALEAELSFYGQVLGFTPPGIPRLTLTEPRTAAQEALAAPAGADAGAGAGAGAAAAPAQEAAQAVQGRGMSRRRRTAEGAGTAPRGDVPAEPGQSARVANSAS